MASVRRVAPVLLLAVTVAAWADGPQPQTAASTSTVATTTTTTITTTTSAPVATAPAAKTTSAKPAKHTAKPRKTSAKAEGSSRPPRDLHMVRNHWTAYNPPDPATYPPTAKSYTIKQGDTLSGIARQQYGKAELWPQLWESNTWITDAHWIYPDDVLLVQGEGANAAVSTTTTTTTTTGTAGNEALSGGQGMTHAPEQPAGRPGIVASEVHRESPPVPLGTETDVYCYGYIGDPNESMPNTIASYEDVEVMSEPSPLDPGSPGSEGDLLFINGGTSTGLVAGETYMAIEPGDLIVHPVTGAVLGRHYNFEGQIRILCADATHSRGRIVQNCREIHPGAHLKPMPQLPIPIARVPEVPGFCDPASARSIGYIVSSQDWYEGLAEGNLVEVNLGQADQIQPGDFLTVYRDLPGKARQILGEVGILTTQAHSATGRIVAMRRAMQIGDQVEAR